MASFSPEILRFQTPLEASAWVASNVLQMVQERRANGERTVLGLATGETPIEVYRQWVRSHREASFDWSTVTAFNLDEYWPLDPSHPHSFRSFMVTQLFQDAGFREDHCHIPSGLVGEAEISRHCDDYEQAIRESGGIDLQLLGIGLNGHIGFNEPGSERASRTRLVELADQTRKRARLAFAPEPVPGYGITMGIGTILESRRVIVMAFGAEKAEPVHRALHGPVDTECPASFLQEHPAVTWVLDEAAGSWPL